jgi:hypothetical protein
MSSNSINRLLKYAGYDDPKEVALVENITEKTKSGKIVWEKTPSSLIATVPGMQISFVRAAPSAWSSLMGSTGSWDMFSIRSQNGAEIMKVEQPPTTWLIAPPPGTAESTPPPRGKLAQAVDALYEIADTRGSCDIDKAINVIKNL